MRSVQDHGTLIFRLGESRQGATAQALSPAAVRAGRHGQLVCRCSTLARIQPSVAVNALKSQESRTKVADAKAASRIGCRMAAIAILAAAFAATCGASQRAPVSGVDKRWAIIVGINEYLNQSIPTLQYCDADARLVARCLQERCGYSADRIVLVTDDQADARLHPLRRNVLAQLEASLNKAGADGTVLVYFSGHGLFLDGKGYLLPQDCEKNRLAETALPIKTVADMLQQCPARQKLLILDCCHAGTTRGLEGPGPSSQELGEAFRQARGLVTLASCRKTERSHEWHARKQGVFTYFLAEGLAGAADYDRNGVVDSDELYRYTMDKVPTTAQQELNAEQTPVRIIGDDAVGVFPLAKVGSGGRTMVPLQQSGKSITNTIGMTLVSIPAGRFDMGSPAAEEARDEDEGPLHPVRIVRAFYLGAHEVTQGQYERVMGRNPSHFTADGPRKESVAGLDVKRFPVEGITWEEARRFCLELSRLPEERREGRRYRLPTEAEWEYACRAGTRTAFWCGATLESTQANFNGGLPYGSVSSGPWLQRPASVGSYPPNPWGLYDMQGNVWEWCEDWYGADYYGRSAQDDPRGPDAGSVIVVRGGAWTETGTSCRAADRFSYPPSGNGANVGFRVLCEVMR